MFFRLNVKEAALKFSRPMFVSSPGLCALSRLLRFWREFQESRKSLGHMLYFICPLRLNRKPECEKINVGTLESLLSPTLILRTIFILQVCDPDARRRRARGFAARVRYYGSICHPLGIRDVNMHIMYSLKVMYLHFGKHNYAKIMLLKPNSVLFSKFACIQLPGILTSLATVNSCISEYMNSEGKTC